MEESATQQETTTTPELGPNAQFGAALDEVESSRSADDGEVAKGDDKPDTEGDADPAPVPVDDKARRAENYRNAQKRIERKRSRRNAEARMAELTERLKGYEGATDPAKVQEARQLEDRILDMKAVSDDDAENDFESRAESVFGENTPKFLEDSARYGEYINKCEPEVRAYIDRPYGLVLLRAWYRRMDQQNLRQEWLGMTPYEKGRALDNLYRSIRDGIENRGSAQTRPQVVAPVPAGGRSTSTHQPTGDPWSDAFNEVVSQRRAASKGF